MIFFYDDDYFDYYDDIRYGPDGNVIIIRNGPDGNAIKIRLEANLGNLIINEKLHRGDDEEITETLGKLITLANPKVPKLKSIGVAEYFNRRYLREGI